MFGRNSKKLREKLEDLKSRVQELKAERTQFKSEREALIQKISDLEGDTWKKLLPPGVPLQELAYNADGLSVWGKNLDFLQEERFKVAYAKGSNSGHLFAKDSQDLHIEWRVHVILWAAGLGLKLDGDFVECGVNTGIFSLAVAEYHQFCRSGRKFFLFDTFQGTPEDQMNPDERAKRLSDNAAFYPDCYEQAKKNFSPYPNMELIRGRVPDTLAGAGIEKVAYLSIDMNVAVAELAAIEFFWDKLQPGAPVVFDDYGWTGCESQKSALDQFAVKMGTAILTLPTGQGLLIKA